MQAASPSGLKHTHPFVGLGFSASGEEALTIARAIRDGKDLGLPNVDMLNIGVSRFSPPPSELRDALESAGLSSVAHLEELNLVGNLDEAILEATLAHCEELNPAWIQEDLGIWVWKDGALGAQMVAPILDAESLNQATRNINRIQEASRFPFLAENPPFYVALGDMDLLDFMLRLSENTGCGLLLDIGHFIGYCMCVKRDPIAYLADWNGFDRIVELHLAGHNIANTSAGPLWTDDHHDHIKPKSLEILDFVMSRASHIKAVTIEAEAARLDVLCGNVQAVASRLQPAQEAA